MTIATTQSSITVEGNGATTSFSFPFIGDSSSYISVQYTNADGAATLLEPFQYTIFLNPPATGQIWGIGGTVVYPLSGSPIAAGTSLTISRVLPFQQLITIADQGDFSAQVIEEMGDTLEMQIQQVAARTGSIRGTWVTGTFYNYGDIVTDGINGNDTGNLYSCAVANTSGIWATDLANGDWSLALNVQAIINTLPAIPNNTVFANISGITAAPTGVLVSALFDAVFGSTQGEILFRSNTGWQVLTPGTAGQVLESGGTGANPSWASTSGGGTITGVTAGSGLTGGGTSGNVTVGFAMVADGSLLANASGGAASPIATTLSALIDHVISNTQGAILYRNGTIWTALSPGTAGQLLQTAGAAANPSWGSAPTATSSTLGISKPDNTTVTISAGILSAGLMTALGVGSLVMGQPSAGLAAGATIAGASLASYGGNPTTGGGSGAYWNLTGDALSGTWRALQTVGNPAGFPSIVQFQRIV